MDISTLKNKIIAVDFDNTITHTSKYPITGEIDLRTIEVLKMLQQQNNKLILWTCREGEELIEAVQLCEKHNILFDAINENIDGTYTRKIKADYYIDDKALIPLWKGEMKNGKI